MNTSKIKIPFKLRFMSALRVMLDSFTIVFFKLRYWRRGKKMPPITDDILRQPAVEVARKIRNKEITSVEVVDACIRRIKAINPIVNCLVADRFELALQEARKADEILQSGSKTVDQLMQETPFLGVPFTAKDSISVKGLPQTAGIFIRKCCLAEEDAKVIALLRENGAIIIGVTNVPELCMWWESYNKLYGRTSNPYNTTRIVGGSSGGEGCIQAAAGSCFGIGSDIGGSIRMPAYFNGVFGHKPSKKVVSNHGQYPIAETNMVDELLCIGPLTKFAVDLKHILKVIGGENSKKLKLDEPVDIGKIKVFYQYSNNAPITSKVDPEIKSAIDKIIKYFATKYKIVSEQKNIEELKVSAGIWFSDLASSASSEVPMGDYLMKNYSYSANIREIMKSLVGLSKNTLVVLLAALAVTKPDKTKSEDAKYYKVFGDNLKEIFKEMLGDNGIFIFPVHPTPAPYHNQTILRPMNFMYTAIINSLGLPATSVPMGLSSDGVPIGIQVIANLDNDRLCLAVAEDLEKEFGGWIES
ncbi:fatty-acid amide hydrolase 2-like [Melitaea cinxia]|uniref:fatty-acid amide hydrolase 2-like n=1 Tax=Melitaea cinxia TaxID=113334 RepID=UPI001E274B46|nr:fatty-acid amide hydrolase 2-like [Melitaea cinxia]